MDTDSEAFEALERPLLEIDALKGIVCDGYDLTADGEESNRNFIVTTPDDLARAEAYINNSHSNASLNETNIPCIGVETFVTGSDQSTMQDGIRLRISLPPGYPSIAAAKVTVVSTPKDFPRSNLDQLSMRLSTRTKDMVGCEVMMEIINECRDAIDTWEASLDVIQDDMKDSSTMDMEPCTVSFSRRWIWVHHITNSDRLKQIVQEARQLKLGGYLKGGYPGVIVIEGPTQACEEFVTWIKGNKSRPGGFGRNWGHHVRGETSIEEPQLPKTFEELDDMGIFGALCKDFGVEDEFREFILQHK